jgi:hypothetical protein
MSRFFICDGVFFPEHLKLLKMRRKTYILQCRRKFGGQSLVFRTGCFVAFTVIARR